MEDINLMVQISREYVQSHILNYKKNRVGTWIRFKNNIIGIIGTIIPSIGYNN